jgi:hypothetical protein
VSEREGEGEREREGGRKKERKRERQECPCFPHVKKEQKFCSKKHKKIQNVKSHFFFNRNKMFEV